MALNFPINPNDGDTYEGYVYDATTGVWNANQGQIVSRFSTSSNQPTSPKTGDAWFNPANGKTYIYYDNFWVESGNPVLGYLNLNNITDVDLNSPTDGQALVYDSANSNWVNETPASTISGLSDTSITSPSESQLLAYNSSTSQWENTNSLQGDLFFSGAERSILTSDSNNLVLGTNNTSAITIDTNQNIGVGVSSPSSKFQTEPTAEGESTFRLGNILNGAQIASGSYTSGNQNISVDFNGRIQQYSGFLILNANRSGSYGSSSIYHYVWRRTGGGNSQLTQLAREHWAFDGVTRIQTSLTESSSGNINFVINSWSTGAGDWTIYFIPLGAY